MLHGVYTEGYMGGCDASSAWVCPGKWMEWRDVLVRDYATPIVHDHPKAVASGVLITVISIVAGFAFCIAQRRRVRTAVRKAQHEISEIQHQATIRQAKGTVEGEGLTVSA
jgi:hypothetical protein